MNEMDAECMSFEYEGSAENEADFHEYVTKILERKPSTEFPSVKELASDWAKESGIRLKFGKTIDEKGKLITLIIEDGYDLVSIIGKEQLNISADASHPSFYYN